MLADDLALRRLGRMAQGVRRAALAVRCAGIVWTPDKVAAAGRPGQRHRDLLLRLRAGGAFCFWTVEGKEVMNIFSYGGVAGGYPLDIYADWLRRFVTFVLPLAFVSYYPALYILDRPDPLGLPDGVRLLSPVAAVC